MSKIITFTFHSDLFKQEIREQFTPEQFGLSEQLTTEQLRDASEKLFNQWVWHQINGTGQIGVLTETDFPKEKTE